MLSPSALRTRHSQVGQVGHADQARPSDIGARALYLLATSALRVGCTDEALVVTNEQRQTWRYPVTRLARVVSSTTADWSGAALALCMRRDIPIAWQSGQGTPLGTCYPQARRSTGFATALELLVEQEPGLATYRNWQRARRLEILVRCLAESAKQPGHTPSQPLFRTAQQWEAAKREWVYSEHHAQHLPDLLRAHCLAYVGASLVKAELVPLLWGPQAQPIHLDQDLCALIWAEMNLKVGSLAQTPTDTRTSVELFDRWSAHTSSALLVHLHSLQRLAMKALYG